MIAIFGNEIDFVTTLKCIKCIFKSQQVAGKLNSGVTGKDIYVRSKLPAS